MPKGPKIKHLLELALAEDCTSDDVTSRLIPNTPTRASVIAREPGVFSGAAVVEAAQEIFSDLNIVLKAGDGARFEVGQTLVELQGSARSILALERTLLNFLGHTCGVATLTSAYVDAVKPHSVKILATRKTLPGLRALQLSAVAAGGGFVHRRSLSDGILIKENHLLFSAESDVLQKAKQQRSPLHRIEIEVQNFQQLEAVLKESPDIIMLDNFSIEDIPKAVKLIGGRAEIEVSGGVTLEKAKRLAPLGIHSISVGQLTHSASWLNVSMDYQK